MKKVVITPGCISCGLCERIAPEVFEVTDEGAFVKKGVDTSKYAQEIADAQEACPVEVIQIEEER